MRWYYSDGAQLLIDYQASFDAPNGPCPILQGYIDKAPPLTDQLYWSAFQELSTERQLGMAVGHIPVSKIWEWAERMNMTKAESRALVYVVRAMDLEFINVQNEKSKSQSERP